MDSINVNLACGDTFIKGWDNLDYSPVSICIKKANLLGVLPFPDNHADFIYSSHFIEHIPRENVHNFLHESCRILKPGHRIRLVLPDLEEICRAYLVCRAREQHEKANFIILEMLDQCIRTTQGGEMGELYRSLETEMPYNLMLRDFIRMRTGHVFDKCTRSATSTWQRVRENPTLLWSALQRRYCNAILRFLPSAFRHQNVSLANVGERHAWVYDFHSIKVLLERAGFAQVERWSASTSGCAEFPFYPLDLAVDGSPRKGQESMYIEAIKP